MLATLYFRIFYFHVPYLKISTKIYESIIHLWFHMSVKHGTEELHNL